MPDRRPAADRDVDRNRNRNLVHDRPVDHHDLRRRRIGPVNFNDPFRDDAFRNDRLGRRHAAALHDGDDHAAG